MDLCRCINSGKIALSTVDLPKSGFRCDSVRCKEYDLAKKRRAGKGGMEEEGVYQRDGGPTEKRSSKR